MDSYTYRDGLATKLAVPFSMSKGDNLLATDAALDKRLQTIKVWDAMFRGARRYVEGAGFTAVHNMPEIVGVTGACENIDTLFKLDYFGKQAYLAQSDQLYLELLTPYLGKVYAEIQSFRMEPEADDRHLTQFSLFEIEHQGGLSTLIHNVDKIVSNAVAECLPLFEHDKTSDHYMRLHKFAYTETPRVTYTEAVDALRNAGWGGQEGLQWGDDLKAHHEAEIVALFGPCFIAHYPKAIKFFNMRQNEKYADIVNSCDLLLPFAGESAGAAERETEYDTIVERLHSSDMYKLLKEQGVNDEDFDWYLDFHKGKDIPLHSGAGIGMARVAQFILGEDDIRNAVPFVLNSENLL